MTQRKIRVIVFPVDKTPEVRVIPATLAAMQSIVHGLIEPVYLSEELVIFVDEEGLLKSKPQNRALTAMVGFPLVGDGFICREDADGESCDVTDEDITNYGAFEAKT